MLWLGRGASPRPRAWFIAGALATTAVALVDLARSREVMLTAVVIGPLLAAIGASAGGVTILAAYALALALVLGAAHDIFLEGDHIVRLVVVILGGGIAIASARLRQRRDDELEIARPQAADAQRLRLALDAGKMGTWRWDLRTGRITWDERLETLYGLAPGSFDSSFTMYESLLHPEDREMVLESVRSGMRRNVPWRFDHRVVWPDGSVHWLEGRGEPVHDRSGAIVGASGVTINIDARHALLDIETRAREAAEQSSEAVQSLAETSTALADATTVDEVGEVIVDRAVRTLHARSGYFATVDVQTNELVMRAQSGYPDWIDRNYARVSLDAPVPGVEAIRTGEPIFIESPEHRRERYPQYADDPTHDAFVVLPLAPLAGARAVLAFGFSERRGFDDGDRSYIAAVVEACAQALQRATAHEAQLATLSRLRTLLDSSEQLGALDDPDRVVETIVSLAATRIGAWATVIRILPDNTLERTAVVHGDPALTPLTQAVKTQLLPEDHPTLQRVIDTGEPMLLNGLPDFADAITADDELRAKLDAIGFDSYLLVPITIAGRRLAVLSIGASAPARLGPNDVELAVDLGRRGASALERAQLWQASQRQLEAEQRIVELLQRTIIPDRLPALPGVQVAAAYRPAEVEVDVGGDWYDAFVAPDDSIVVVVGDVAGHGVQAASVMGRVRNALRAYAIEDTEPSSILIRLHTLLRAHDSLEMVTAFVARYDPARNTMTWSRAGHPPALLVGPGGSALFLEQVNGAPLGTMASEYRSAVTPMPAGSLLVCYTDGLIERRDRIIDDGLDWLQQRVREYVDDDIDTLCNKLVDDPFVPHPSPDDICVLAMRTDPV
jgi:serine phosphatase RsbU (regulator of sigma subunit)/PAS domain-containing protein